jgi:hypothetical protein
MLQIDIYEKNLTQETIQLGSRLMEPFLPIDEREQILTRIDTNLNRLSMMDSLEFRNN